MEEEIIKSINRKEHTHTHTERGISHLPTAREAPEVAHRATVARYRYTPQTWGVLRAGV